MSNKHSVRRLMELRLFEVACDLVTALCLFPCANAQPSRGAVLTLDEALRLARSNNRDLKQCGLEVVKQREAVGEAKTYLYPRFDTSLLAAELLGPLDFTINKGQLGTFPGTGPIPGSNTDLHTPARPIAIASVTATQPLTQLLRIHLFIAGQRLKVDAARSSFDQREQKLTDDVRQSYYQVLQEQIQHESQVSTANYLEELLQLTERRVNEEMHEKGESLERALPDAGIERIRPVMITVGATILALFPLALEGGPLWKPLYYAQIGGLAVATFITLLLVPVFYSIFVLDLKWIKWETREDLSQNQQ
jgi:hypothetical protein